MYLEHVALSLFPGTIGRASAAGVLDFELLVQSWVLRVGHYPLKTDYSDFIGVINEIVDWTSVNCGATELIYDETSASLPKFVGLVDCEILETVYVPPPPPVDCTNPTCTMQDSAVCCASNSSSDCCVPYFMTFQMACGFPGCEIPGECCSFNPNSQCCVSA